MIDNTTTQNNDNINYIKYLCDQCNSIITGYGSYLGSSRLWTKGLKQDF